MKKIVWLLLMFGVVPLSGLAQDAADGIKVPPEVAPFIENGTKAFALETADLNGDGTQDFVLVLEEIKANPEEDEGQRSLLILIRGAADDKLTLAKRNDKGLVFCRTCGGVFGDPFESLSVGLKTLTVNMYGGSNYRWAYSYKFNYSRIDKTWQLVSVQESHFHTSDPDKGENKTYLPPRHFGKIDIADFDPDNFKKKGVK